MSQRIIESFPQTRSLPVGVARLGLMSKIYSGGTPDKSREEYWTGEIPWLGSGSVNQRLITEPTAFISEDAVAKSATRLFRKGSLTIALAGQGKTKATVARLGIDAYGNQSMACIDKYQGEPQFLFWWLNSLYKEIRALSSEDTRDGLNQSIIGQLPIPLYEFLTQKRIAAFLDRETARIDKLIAKKERLAEILKEREIAALEELIWGDGPETKLGHHISILPGYAFASANFSENPDDIRLLRGANVGVGEVRWDDTVYWPATDVIGHDRFKLSAGDIVMGMDRPWISGGIRVAEVQEKDLPCLLLQRVCKIAPLSTLSGRYLKAIIESKRFIAYFEPILTGVSVPHISGDQIANFRFPFVPIEDQEQRMSTLEGITRSTIPISRATKASVDRLREYRAALITAAVTGQIDVDSYSKSSTSSVTLDRIEEEMQG